MAAPTDLAALLTALDPAVVEGAFVFVTLDALDATLPTHATIEEAEGITCVIKRSIADQRGLDYDFVAGWITLRAHSALNTVGVTAAVSTALAEADISCNVLAGRYHDHLLVPYERRSEALDILATFTSR